MSDGLPEIWSTLTSPWDGAGQIEVDSQGRIVHADPFVSKWLGLNADFTGLSLGSLIDVEGRDWLLSTLSHDGLGAQERLIVSKAGYALRFWPCGGLRFRVLDDSTYAAVCRERVDGVTDGARAGFAAAVARELNDPMSIVQGRLELLLELDSADPEMVRRHVSVALDHARRISSTLHQLRLVGGPLDDGLEVTSARRLLRRAARGVSDLDLEVDLQPDTLRLVGSADLLKQVFMGLLRRIRDASRDGHRTRAVGWETHGHAIVEFRSEPSAATPLTPIAAPGDPRLDVGVSELVLDRIGGRLESYRLGRGLLFRLALPKAPPAQRRRLQHRGHVVVVGASTPTNLCALLFEEGVNTTCIAGSEEALLSLSEARPDGLVTALDLPGVSGLTLLRSALERWPELATRCVLMARTEPVGVPDGVVVCRPPVDRRRLLEGLGLL